MKMVSSKALLKTSIFSVSDEHAVDPQGFEIKRAIIHHPGSAVIMPIDDKKRILLVRQYRLPARRFMWELPAGRIDQGETALQAAKRELGEETGFKASRWTKVMKFYASPGYVEEAMTIFAAEGLTEGPQNLMDDERIDIAWFTQRELDDMIAAGKMQDGKTLIGYLSWKRYGGQKRSGSAAKAVPLSR
jgi:ADP-ribose pyrophosphatase